MRITVQAKPNAYEEKVEKIGDNLFKVSVTAMPVGGQANMAVIRAMAKYFNVSPLCVRIISGKTSRTKILEIN